MADYVRNIAVFLIFTSFVGIILPNGKYKSYCNLVLGLILILIIIKPATDFVDGIGPGVDKLLGMVTGSVSSKGSGKASKGSATASPKDLSLRDEVIQEAFDRLVVLQVEEALQKEGYPSPKAVSVKTKVKGEGADGSLNFDILSINLGYEELSEEEMNFIKKSISDFYNLSVANINITVQKR